MPPFSRILALAVSVNLSAAIVSLGTSSILLSSVTVPTTTAILPLKALDTLRDLLLGAEVLHQSGDGNRGSVHL